MVLSFLPLPGQHTHPPMRIIKALAGQWQAPDAGPSTPNAGSLESLQRQQKGPLFPETDARHTMWPSRSEHMRYKWRGDKCASLLRGHTSGPSAEAGCTQTVALHPGRCPPLPPDNRDQPCGLLPNARWTSKDHRRARWTVQQGEHLPCMQLTQVGKEKETGKP